MDLNQVIKKIHRLLESNNDGERIVYEDMAENIGVSTRAYSEYYRGKNQPLGMKVLLRMLNNLKDEQILEVVRMWKEEHISRRPTRKDKKDTAENISKE
jgi:transcriptional regulator with XRE-family HTH domain